MKLGEITEKSYEETGGMSITEADEMNIPMNSFLEEEDGVWVWTAGNFMPRRGHLADGQYEIKSKSKAVILELVRKHVIPLYQAATSNLVTKGENYYWEAPTPEAKS